MTSHTIYQSVFAVFMLLAPVGVARAAECGNVKPDARDAITFAPANHRLLFENDVIRAYEGIMLAHTVAKAHNHPWAGVLVDDRNRTATWAVPGPQEDNPNNTDVDRRFVRIDFKRADCEPFSNPALPPTDRGFVKDSGVTVMFENEYIRVLRTELNPGGKETMHTHTWPAVLISWRRPPSRRVTASGKAELRPEVKELQATYSTEPETPHYIENVSNEMYVGYRVELKPVTGQAAKK